MRRRMVTAEQIAAIEMRLAAGQVQWDIALAVGVSQAVVSNVKLKRYSQRVLSSKQDRTLIENARAAVDTVDADSALERLAALAQRKAEDDFIKAQTAEAAALRAEEAATFASMQQAQAPQKQAQEKAEGEK